MLSAKWRAVAVVVLAFVLGGVVGIAGDRYLNVFPPEPPDPSYVADRITILLSRRLDLTSEQRVEVEKIVHRFTGEIEALLKENQPRFRALSAKADREIDAVLTPEQREEFREVRRERDQRFPFK
jgi:hypothetical protein